MCHLVIGNDYNIAGNDVKTLTAQMENITNLLYVYYYLHLLVWILAHFNIGFFTYLFRHKLVQATSDHNAALKMRLEEQSATLQEQTRLLADLIAGKAECDLADIGEFNLPFTTLTSFQAFDDSLKTDKSMRSRFVRSAYYIHFVIHTEKCTICSRFSQWRKSSAVHQERWLTKWSKPFWTEVQL